MDPLHEKLKSTISIEEQSFEDKEANPYEIAVATAKYAREINEKARKYLGSDVDIYPRSLALKKFSDEETHVVYSTEEPVVEEPAKKKAVSKTPVTPEVPKTENE